MNLKQLSTVLIRLAGRSLTPQAAASRITRALMLPCGPYRSLLRTLASSRSCRNAGAQGNMLNFRHVKSRSCCRSFNFRHAQDREVAEASGRHSHFPSVMQIQAQQGMGSSQLRPLMRFAERMCSACLILGKCHLQQCHVLQDAGADKCCSLTS